MVGADEIVHEVRTQELINGLDKSKDWNQCDWKNGGTFNKIFQDKGKR